MFERFTDEARKVMALANEQVQRFGHKYIGTEHNYIGTEHILLGLLRETDGIAAKALTNLKVMIKDVREKAKETKRKTDD
jgi:ATP-dependent Clp protease ATP-binding subunit ClpC